MANLIDASELRATPFQPKETRRFVFRVDGFPTFVIKKADKPKMNQSAIEIPHINVTQKIKGKTKYDNITVELYDPIKPSATQMVQAWQSLHAEAATGRDGYQDFYKKDVTFQTLGPVGDIVEEWVLKGAFIESVDYGTGDWGDDSGIMMINLTLAYDYPILNY